MNNLQFYFVNIYPIIMTVILTVIMTIIVTIILAVMNEGKMRSQGVPPCCNLRSKCLQAVTRSFFAAYFVFEKILHPFQ
jgi:hypothetical protein